MGYIFQVIHFMRVMVARGRVQLPTFALGVRCSMHLSYRATWQSQGYDESAVRPQPSVSRTATRERKAGDIDDAA